MPVGGGANSCVVGTVPTTQQRLCGTSGNRRNLDSHSHGTPDAQKAETNLIPICHTPSKSFVNVRRCVLMHHARDGSSPPDLRL